MIKIAKKVNISGKVQGVGYRFWLKNKAIKCGLCGWVRNMPNGSVEALLIGKDFDVSQIIKECELGPNLSFVAKVKIYDVNESYENKFDIIN